jgi:hypothetical protein
MTKKQIGIKNFINETNNYLKGTNSDFLSSHSVFLVLNQAHVTRDIFVHNIEKKDIAIKR